MIRVLIVDDSKTSRILLRHIVTSAPDMTVIGELADGEEAVSNIKKLRPDVILMDVVMPKMDGMEATQAIMAQFPTPIVMISATAQGREAEMAFQAIKRGALSLLSKPDGPEHPEYEAQAARLISTLRAMAGVRVIHHRVRRKLQDQTETETTATLAETLLTPPEIIGVVSSTGGPAALVEIFQVLPADFPLPIVVVQHINSDFQQSLLNWVSSSASLPVRFAVEGEKLTQGITFAPGGRHLIINSQRRFVFQDTPKTAHIPSGDMLLNSIAEIYGAASVGVILTGMGADGATGLLAMHRQGALTIGQNERTCAVYGMPGEARRIGAVRYELALGSIASMLRESTERTARYE